MNNSTATIGSTELRLRIRDVLERVKYGGEHFIITNFGRPMAVLLGLDEYQKLMQIKQSVEHQLLQGTHNLE
jgi:prevent-host-death family protein